MCSDRSGALVSVVIPSYNYGHLLPRCLESVLSQPAVDVKVLLIDDCSPDGSAEVARRLAEADPRVEAVLHRQNRGHIASYNEGLLDWADGDYTVLLSADDLLTPGSLARAVAALESAPDATFAYGYAVSFQDGAPLPRPRTGRGPARIWPGEQWIARRCRSGTNIISSPEVMVRTAVQQQVGGYRADLPHSGDLEMWLRLAAHGDVAVLAGTDQAYYRVHPASMSRTSYRQYLPDLEQRHAAFEGFFDTTGSRLTTPEPWRRAAALATARRALWRAGRVLASADPDAAAAAEALAGFACRISPESVRTAEYRAWRWAREQDRRWAQAEMLVTAARGRWDAWRYDAERRWRCV